MKRSYLWLAFAALLVNGAAEAASCGVFVEKETGSRIEFNTDGSAREINNKGIVQQAFWHYRNGAALNLRNQENSLAENYQLSADGKTMAQTANSWGSKTYTAGTPYSCAPTPSLAYLEKAECEYGKEAACCASGDMGACVKDADNKKNASRLKTLCDTQPAACLALIDVYEAEANPRGDADLFNLYAEKKPLPAARTREVAAMCERFQTPDLCRKSLEQLWRATRFAEAAGLMGKMCQWRVGDDSCDRAGQLKQVKLTDSLEPAKSLPCGEYKVTVSALTGDLNFGDRGLVPMPLGGQLRARLENGVIKMRHDKGGDFIFARLDDNTLLGLDSWNRFEVLKRAEAPAQACQLPVSFKEVPLSTSCGLDKDPAQCCQAGDTQGCNRQGTMAAMSNDWAGAAGYYAKVCEKGVRIGCENWAFTISKTGDAEGVKGGLEKLCQQDPQHVACDVLETTNFPMFMLSYGLEHVGEERDAKKAKKRK